MEMSSVGDTVAARLTSLGDQNNGCDLKPIYSGQVHVVPPGWMRVLCQSTRKNEKFKIVSYRQVCPTILL